MKKVINSFSLAFTLIVFWVPQLKGQSEGDLKKLKTGFDSLNRESSQIIRSFIQSDWENRYSAQIKRNNPDFSIDPDQKVESRFVPMLVIPKEVLERDSINLMKYFSKGEIDLFYSTIYLVQDNKPIGTFMVIKGSKYLDSPYSFNPVTFHKSFPQSRVLEVMKASVLNFKLGIRSGEAMYFFPFLIHYTNNHFMYFNSIEEKSYPIEELYKSWENPDKEKFRQYINALVESCEKGKK